MSSTSEQKDVTKLNMNNVGQGLLVRFCLNTPLRIDSLLLAKILSHFKYVIVDLLSGQIPAGVIPPPPYCGIVLLCLASEVQLLSFLKTRPTSTVSFPDL